LLVSWNFLEVFRREPYGTSWDLKIQLRFASASWCASSKKNILPKGWILQ